MQENRRHQKNITLTDEQMKFIEANFGKMSIGQISKLLGVGYNKIHNNLRMVGKVKTLQAKVVSFDNNGYFDVDKFARYYNY